MSSIRRFLGWSKEHVWGGVLAALIAAAILGGIAYLWERKGDDESLALVSSISTPEQGEQVSSPFAAAGTLAELPAGHHVWLAAEIQGGLFPKQPEITSLGPWEAEVSEQASRFSLVLLRVDGSGQRKIENWFSRGQATGSFRALTIPDSERLDVVSGLKNDG